LISTSPRTLATSSAPARIAATARIQPRRRGKAFIAR
jgi:hypothetical protein